ncbi:hypothetical protein LWI28_014700 [Acer negundo]|uniref:Uncharacterized protein n=1 Tax=Acer negundo TaxID=4023 RepID=A0AAD5NRH0_ACENE|nr:hypothetical protein LWI28_014700 [Acer negundo]KAK4845655.1 hypothetical protein QYF36_007548 [Acer negundo]
MGCGISKIDPEEVGNVADTKFLPKHAAAPTQLEDAESLDYDHKFDRKSVSSAMGGNVGKVACGGGDGGDEDMRDNYDDHVKVRSDGDCGDDDRGLILAGRDDSIVVCPGSPSFREYCVSTNVSKNGRNSINNHEGRSGANVENKSQGEESLHKVLGEKTKVTKKKSQEKRRSGRVRNLFSNVACYNPHSRSLPTRSS